MFNEISNIARSSSRRRYACVGAVTQQFARTRLDTLRFLPQSVQTSIFLRLDTCDKMSNRTKASEQLEEFAKNQKVCEFYSAESQSEIRDCFFVLFSFFSKLVMHTFDDYSLAKPTFSHKVHRATILGLAFSARSQMIIIFK